MNDTAHDEPLSVAIVGGGITGLVVAIGLLGRGVKVRVYERFDHLDPACDCIGITPNAEWAMKVVDPRIHDTFKRLERPNNWDWSQYVDGEWPSDGVSDFFKVYLGEHSFGRCHQNEFLVELAKLIPPGVIGFGKDLVSLSDGGGEGRVTLNFRDQTTAAADIVIGCDGIRSRTRQCILGEENPASYAHYSHKYLVRGLIDMDTATQALGEEVTSTRLTHLGANAHLMTFPLAQGDSRFLNVVGFVSDPREWPLSRPTSLAARDDTVDAFAHFGPTARTIVGLLPPLLCRWALFDSVDHPADTYVRARLAVAGDAAHAVTPHHGAGPGLALEDAVALCTLLADADRTLRGAGTHHREEVLNSALLVYDSARRERCEWVVRSSRFIGDMYEWQTEAGRDPAKCYQEAYFRAHRIWNYNVDDLVRHCRNEYDARINFWTKYLTFT